MDLIYKIDLNLIAKMGNTCSCSEYYNTFEYIPMRRYDCRGFYDTEPFDIVECSIVENDYF